MFSYPGEKDASSCIIQLSTEDPDRQKEQTTNLPHLHDFVVSLTISPPISRSHELATDNFLTKSNTKKSCRVRFKVKYRQMANLIKRKHLAVALITFFQPILTNPLLTTVISNVNKGDHHVNSNVLKKLKSRIENMPQKLQNLNRKN